MKIFVGMLKPRIARKWSYNNGISCGNRMNMTCRFVWNRKVQSSLIRSFLNKEGGERPNIYIDIFISRFENIPHFIFLA
jgi:hypothetical protein